MWFLVQNEAQNPPKIDAQIDTINDDFLDPLKKSADLRFLRGAAPPPLPNLPPYYK